MLKIWALAIGTTLAPGWPSRCLLLQQTDRQIMLRDTREDFTNDTLLEMTHMWVGQALLNKAEEPSDGGGGGGWKPTRLL
jgi:hypothetical protein